VWEVRVAELAHIVGVEVDPAFATRVVNAAPVGHRVRVQGIGPDHTAKTQQLENSARCGPAGGRVGVGNTRGTGVEVVLGVVFFQRTGERRAIGSVGGEEGVAARRAFAD
jgi:hypothetical protein